MELRQLVSFYHVARLRSVSKAARTLELGQPTVTTHLRKLEDEFAITLFDRIKRPIQLTSEGFILLELVTPVVQAVDTLKTQMDYCGEQSSYSDILLDRVNPTDADLASDETLNAWLMRNTGTSHHISGTCKMGPDSDPMAVLDQYCHVRGIEALRVADASVMPDCIRANTNATTIMIGEKVADWIKEGR